MELALASPATGPMSRVWFSSDGGRLYAVTQSGRLLESSDFENWSAVTTPAVPGAPELPRILPDAAGRLPVSGAKLYPHPQIRERLYALGANLYRSEDGGRSWTNLTAFGNNSVIGEGQRDLAVSPRDPDLLVVANDFGAWRSADGGLSWSGLNQALPNLAVRRILSTPRGATGVRIAVDNLGALELPAGGEGEWRPVGDALSQLDRDASERRTYSVALGTEITAIAGSGDTLYVGAADGRIWVSADRGRAWTSLRIGSGNAIVNIHVDQQEPRLALAVLGGRGAHVLRTINAGVSWDDLTSNLPDAAAHAIAVDRQTGAAYVATDRGLFYAVIDLERSAPASSWTPLSESLPAAAVNDVRLDSAGNRLYIALEGYGVFAATAPHRARALRLVNAADFSARAAAPGSLMSVLGGRVSNVRAGGLSFPVLDASETESQIQVPFEAAPAGPSISLALESAGRQFTFPLPLQSVSPAIFIDRDGAPMLLDADSGLILDARNTARAGGRIQILTTGLGRVRPDWPTGMPAPLQNPPAVQAAVSVYLDRAPVEVLRSTLAPGYVGFYLIEIQLPAIVNAGPAELYINAGGQESNRVRIHLEQ